MILRRSCGRQDGNDNFDVQGSLCDTISPGGEPLRSDTDLQIRESQLRTDSSFQVLVRHKSGRAWCRWLGATVSPSR